MNMNIFNMDPNKLIDECYDKDTTEFKEQLKLIQELSNVDVRLFKQFYGLGFAAAMKYVLSNGDR